MIKTKKKLVLTGGGSAGHCVPNLALVDALKCYFDIYYIGSSGIEKKLVKDKGLPYYELNCTKLNRAAKLSNLLLPFKLFKSISDAKKILKTIKPDVVFSKGGYVALPVVLASKKMKIKTLAHESDLSLGLANKISSKKCDSVLTSFDETAKKLPNGIYSGAPIRQELFCTEKFEGLKRYNLDRRKTILIFAGGSGSVKINNCLRECLAELTKKYNVLHICGKGNLCKKAYKNYVQIEYEEQMEYAYAVADLIICRGGANTLFEIIALKKKSIVIPLSKASSRGDQIENANYFSNKGLCEVIMQENLTPYLLLMTIENTLQNEQLQHNLKTTSLTAGNDRIINLILNSVNF